MKGYTSSSGLPPATSYGAATFRRLLDSLARPGKINQLDYPAFLGEPPVYFSAAANENVLINLFALGAMLTLLDREVSAGIIAEGGWLDQRTPAFNWLSLRSGAKAAEPEEANFVLVCEGDSGGLMARLARGTLLEPENSATVLYCVERLEHDLSRPAAWLTGLTLELAGPGIADLRELRVAGLEPPELELIRNSRRQYPLGVDVYLIDAEGQCVGLPRTTRIMSSASV